MHNLVPAPIETRKNSSLRVSAVEFIPIAIVAGIALIVYLIDRTRHTRRGGA
jgi:hypothetical protein